MKHPVPIIDVFAGPGGLGEGFSSLTDSRGRQIFRIALSIEKEAAAHRTLELRAFYRQYPDGEAPTEYYDFLRGKLGPDPRESLFQLPHLEDAAENAQREARLLTLGGSREKANEAIEAALRRSGSGEWILIGGPPCQAYSIAGRSRNKSKAGYRIEDDDRSTLYREYLQIINDFEPAAFVMENVKGLLSAMHNGDSIFQRILEDLRAPGKASGSRKRSPHEYEIFSLVARQPTSDRFCGSPSPGDYVIRSEGYGIPQARHRVILLGLRRDVLSDRRPKALSTAAPVPLRDAISDLPTLRSGLSRSTDSASAWSDAIGLKAAPVIRSVRRAGMEDVAEIMRASVHAISSAAMERGENRAVRQRYGLYKGMPRALRAWYRDPSGHRLVCNHQTRGHIPEDLVRYLFCASYCQANTSGPRQSPKAEEFPDELAPAHANWNSGHFADRFRVQPPNLPATTVTSHISKDGHYYIHYDPVQCRSLTVREAARIQTFPDNYFFLGNRTQQYVQVGNAVPPLLARQIAEVVADVLGISTG